MNNEPVAWMQTFTQEYKGVTETKHAVNIERIGINDIPLYTHPAQELNDGGEPVKNATYWKRQYNEMSALNDRLKSSLYHANEQIKYLEFHPADLTDEEIEFLASKHLCYQIEGSEVSGVFNFARAILKKAQEK